MNKMQGGKSLYRGLGSIDLTAAARSVLLVTRDPADPPNRVIMQIKNSLAPEGDPVAFRFGEDAEITYLGAYELKLEEALNAERQHTTKQEKAEALLLEWLDKEHPLYIRDMYPIADSEGISRQALQRAKQNLRLVSEKTERGWVWKKPDHTPPRYDTVCGAAPAGGEPAAGDSLRVGRADSRFPPGAVSEAPPTIEAYAARRGFFGVTAPNN